MGTPLIVHVDVDAFFASVEQVLDPALRGRPVIVGGGIEGRGVVASASYEARPFGVGAGMPIHRARELCPEAAHLPPNFEEYNRFAGRLFEVLCGLSPSVAQTSLDDAYVDLTGCRRMYAAWSARPIARLPFLKVAGGIYRRREGSAVPPPRRTLLPEGCRWVGAVGLWIKRAVRARTGLRVTVGIGSNKLVAKAASDFSKPDGIGVVEVGREADLLAMLELKDIPGVGRATTEKLRMWNVRTVREARRLPQGLLADAFGPERGQGLYHLFRGELRGEAAELRPNGPPQSISRETTFWTASGDHEFVESMLFYLTERLGRALRREGLLGRTVQVKLRYEDMATVQRSRSLGQHTDRDEEVFATARALLRGQWRRSRRLRLVGVGLTDLRPARTVQRSLFEDDADRCRRIDRCLDELRGQFGFDVVRRGLTINLTGAGQEI
ncbi:MAG: DNA polymerase Y family protein, partial [Planctomycetota bacterium]